MLISPQSSDDGSHVAINDDDGSHVAFNDSEDAVLLSSDDGGPDFAPAIPGHPLKRQQAVYYPNAGSSSDSTSSITVQPQTFTSDQHFQ